MLSALAGGCTAEEGAETPCTADFDCAYDQVCGEGDVCVAAGAGEQRVFSEVTAEVADGAEVYLLSVFDVPTSAEVASGEVGLSISGGGTDGALRLAPMLPLTPLSADPAWQDRIAFERARRGQINALVDALRSGERSVRPARPRQAACSSDCGTQMCWQGSCVDSVTLKFGSGDGVGDGSDVICDLVAVVDDVGPVVINVLLDSTSSTASAEAEQAARDFASSLELELELLGQAGHSGALDRDGDGRMTIVFTDKTAGALSSSLVGFFLFGDFLPAGEAGATGNEMDLLWSRVPVLGGGASSTTVKLAVGTLVHEYTHLVSYAARVHARNDVALREVGWLDEGIAHLMEDLSGWGASNITTVVAALESWHQAGFAASDDTPEQRGHTYLLLRNVIDRRARALGATSADDATVQQVAAEIVSGLIDEEAHGFEHALFREESADMLWAWSLGVYASGNDDVTQADAHAFDFLAPGTAGTTEVIGITTSGDAAFEDARGQEWLMSGPALGDGSTEELEALDEPLETFVPRSGNLLFKVVNQAAGPLVVRGQAEAGVDLRMRLIRIE